jgi:hypothetical protein
MNTLTSQTLTRTSQPEAELKEICSLLTDHINQYAFAEYLGARESFQIETLNGTNLCCTMSIDYGQMKTSNEVLVPLSKFGALDSAIDSYPDKEVYWLRLSRENDAPIEHFNSDNGRRTHCKSLEIPFSELKHAQLAAELLAKAIAIAIL